jgi:hypothetical protein
VLNLFYPSKRFCSACQQWDKYDELEMSVILRPAKRCVWCPEKRGACMERKPEGRCCIVDGVRVVQTW